MADQLQLRGGTTTEHSTFTGALKEITVDITKKTVVVHDGATAGGTPLARENNSDLTGNTLVDLIRFADADRSNYIGIKAPTTITANITLTLPGTDGSSGQVLSTNGSGVLSWASLSGFTNSQIAADAAIDYSKLAPLTSGNILVGNGSNVATSVAVTGDVTISNTGVTAISAGAIVNADVSASAGIQFSKLAALTDGNILVGNGSNVATPVALSGDVTITNAGVASVIAGSTSVAGKLQLTDSTSSTSTTTAATPAAVKSAYDLANSANSTANAASTTAAAALPKSGGTMTGAITFAAGQTFADASGSFRTLPQNAQTAAYTLVASDTGKHISITTGGVTIPSGVFSAGDIVTIFNNSGSEQAIIQGGSATMRKAGSADTGNRILAQYGVATVLCVSSNTFVVSGSGLS